MAALDQKQAPLTPYQRAGARLVDNGYSAIPIIPGEKIPGVYKIVQGEKDKCWRPAHDWQRFGDRLPTEIELASWSTWPDAGVCVVIDPYLKVIDIDTDDAELTAAIMSVLPDSPVQKRGSKGFSAFLPRLSRHQISEVQVGGRRLARC